ncbi:FAD/NAD(P)-binding domain-containing protein [Glonium stellatum]|uniref:FAD/NAD(P)-binding domain-containing protein n=1 Tax=Glonium stellatum TaxID=574774 RepID=A0A8E2FCF5_9PEZI|nr:FAD/NAD(P)-binding domain-containing protein [Glonium stellatum]
MTTSSPPLPVLIIGAGICGLTLAQRLRTLDIPFKLFERDIFPTARGAGWGLTINWALPMFYGLLPPSVKERLPETYVNRAAVERGETSSFTFFDLSTGIPKWRVPPGERIRVSRVKLKTLLMDSVDIEWSKSFKNFDTTEYSVTAHFEDGSNCEGCILVDCEGTQSHARRSLYPLNHETFKLPIRFIGTITQPSPEQVKEILKLDSFFFHGASSENDSYMYFSFLSAPYSPEEADEKYICQIALTWPFRKGFFGNPEPTEVPQTDFERVALMKRIASTWVEPFRSIVLDIPDDTETKPIVLQDWPPPQGVHGHGRVVMMGDALHPMVMYRGDGANHGIADVVDFFNRLGPYLPHSHAAGESTNVGYAAIRAAIDAYEDDVSARATLAVLASRQACLDAHEWGRLNERSPLFAKRVMLSDVSS